MAQPNPPRPQTAPPSGLKRKEHPSHTRNETNKRARTDHRAKLRDFRTVCSQTSSKALKNGELDVDKFVKAREYEIRALEDGMTRSKKALNTRAFQQVPKELRRRTASHNAKRVPRRLQSRAKREMIEDNTPTVTAKKRRPTRHMRLRIETAKKLRSLGSTSKTKNGEEAMKVTVKPLVPDDAISGQIEAAVKARKPKVKEATLAAPPVAKARFRKRQISKTWLPTHMFHAKRARMTPPKESLWNFAVPLTPTAKSYRPTHRAANETGAVAWDTSYMSTIRLEGQQRSLESTLKALGLGVHDGKEMWTRKGEKWRNGTRVWHGLLFEREAPSQPIGPATVIWCVYGQAKQRCQDDDPQKHKRALLIRVHPSAFSQIWKETVRLSKVVQPHLSVEDLRYEIGSIEVSGPGAVEALQSTLWPSRQANSQEDSAQSIERIWRLLAGLGSQASMPSDALLGFDIQDPRLHHPPRKASPPEDTDYHEYLQEVLATWPVDAQQGPSRLFERRARLVSSSALPSQKAINRRKALASPGLYPEPSDRDPHIPILLHYHRDRRTKESTWTLLLPWKCVQPAWYCLIFCPLSTGGQPRFGGLDETRQLAFEKGRPWYPGDYPGTQAGWAWEMQERAKRQEAWLRKPKSKRINWDALKLGNGCRGEVGTGWACDWELLLQSSSEGASGPLTVAAVKVVDQGASSTQEPKDKPGPAAPSSSSEKPSSLVNVSSAVFRDIIARDSTMLADPGALITVQLRLLTRGVPQACARIYRLPEGGSSNLRKRWLDIHPENQAGDARNGPKHSLPTIPRHAPTHEVRQRLARSLLEAPRPGNTGYPPCPSENDLIGFVTSGNYNLGEGQGSGVGSILLAKVIDGLRRDAVSGSLCVVRNAGNAVGRLAKWEIV